LWYLSEFLLYVVKSDQVFICKYPSAITKTNKKQIKNLLKVHTGNHGVIQTQGDTWRVMRRFGLLSMRTLGVGKAGMEKQVIYLN